MPSAPITPAARAETLLQEWEQHVARPATPANATARPAQLAQLTALCATFRPEAGVSIDHEDIRTVLRSAAHFRIGTAAAAGPDRATKVALAALAALQPPVSSAPTGPAQSALLSIISPAAYRLGMDELTIILEIIQHDLGQDVEMVFGHDDETEVVAVSELCVWLLVGYAATAPAPLALPAPVPPPPPDASGRDAAFVAAAYLLVRHQKASTSLLQRELKLGYNRTGRLMEQLARAGIVGQSPGKDGQWPVLVAGEAELTQLLAHLPPLLSD